MPPPAVAYGPPAPTRTPAPTGFGAKVVSTARPERAPEEPAEVPKERAVAASAPLVSAEVRIEMDKAAGRMVQTFVDSGTGEVLRQFPGETQLAFSRALAAFERARSCKE